MGKIKKADLKNINEFHLTHKTLYWLDDEVLEQRHAYDVAVLLATLDGSRVELYAVPYDDKKGIFLQLRCGEYICEEKLIPGYLSDAIRLAPFMAVCAGKVEPEPSKLEVLERRVERLEKHIGLEDKL